MSEKPYQASPVDILLVEDNAGDIALTIEAFRDAKIANRLHCVRDGDEALDYLFRRGVHVGAKRPDMVLLDLHLPRKSGVEVLSALRADRGLRNIAVVVLTSSAAERAMVEAQQLSVQAYAVKPIDLAQLLSVVAGIENLWLSVVKMPVLVPEAA